MKQVILSADGDWGVYTVPEEVADNLSKYAWKFWRWMKHDPKAKKYRIGPGLCYNERDFIEYLNAQFAFKEKASFSENLGWIEKEADLPEKYRTYPQFHF